MRRVALELAHLGAAWPSGFADIRAFKLPHRMLREGQPETGRVGTRCDVVAIGVVWIGDPERRHRVIRRDQDILGVLSRQIKVRAGRRAEGGKVGRVARLGCVALGLNRQVMDKLIASLDAVFHEEAVTHGVVGDVVLHLQVVGAVHRHAAIESVVNGGVANVLALAFTDQVPVDRIAGQRQVLAHAVEFDAFDIHVTRGHGHDVAAKKGLCSIG